MFPKPVQFVTFGFLTSEVIRKFSVCEIEEAYVNGGSTEKTVYDLRMGPTSRTELCRTCGGNNMICPGHYGFIALPNAFYNPISMRHVVNILNCVCVRCGLIKVSTADALHLKSVSPKDTFANVQKACDSVIMCSSDECRKLKNEERVMCKFSFKPSELAIYRYIGDKKRLTPFSAQECYEAFLNINDSTMNLLGCNWNLSSNPHFTNEVGDHLHLLRPEALLIKDLIVTPPCARACVIREGGVQRNDDLTEQYNSIVKKVKAYGKLENNEITCKVSTRGNSSKTKKDLIKDIAFAIFSLIDAHSLKTKATSKGKVGARVCMSFRTRLEGKKGRIQQNTVAKRSDFAARTVIYGDPTLRLDQVSIPASMVYGDIKQNQIRPYVVTLTNKKILQEKLNSGIVNWVKTGNEWINPTRWIKLKGSLELEEGDVCFLPLREGDWVLLNRQPSLRRESFMALKVKIAPPNVKGFGLSLGYVEPFGADFDGKFSSHCHQQEDASEVERFHSENKRCKPFLVTVYNLLVVLSFENKDEIATTSNCSGSSYLNSNLR